MNVQVIGLKTGEQLLSEVQEQTNEGYLLKKPSIIVPAGDKGLGFAPWIPYTKAANGVMLKHDAISFVVEPLEELKNHYVGTIVGGLVVPSSEVATPKLQLTE
jgi:hypothetical protein